MAKVKPFRAVRPAEDFAARVAALPYDVYNRQEAKEEVQREPHSFLKIDRAETWFSDEVDTYDERVYQKAKELYQQMKQEHIYIEDQDVCYYLYQLTMDGRSQTGIVACASVDDYMNGVIKKHENTREEKEQDRIHHVDTMSAQTGPIFLAYRENERLSQVVEAVKKKTEAMYDFTSLDGIGHKVWKVGNPADIHEIEDAFETIDSIYIADGHHRAASAVKVSLKRRKEHPNVTGKEEFQSFLSVLFPDSELMIMDYNRSVKDLNGLTKEEFLEKIQQSFTLTALDEAKKPWAKGQFTMYLEKQWYLLEARTELLNITDVVDALDVSLLQEYLLKPVLGIEDPRTDERIDFIGGIRGLEELERRASEDMKVSFALYPTSIQELFAVADAGRLMPPKSTWFEPKLRSGLFIHEIEE